MSGGWTQTLTWGTARFVFAVLLMTLLAQSAVAQWRSEWDKSIAAAEKQAQVTVYGKAGKK
jgi:hypothetical protein